MEKSEIFIKKKEKKENLKIKYNNNIYFTNFINWFDQTIIVYDYYIGQ
jgi:hypothetical protein